MDLETQTIIYALGILAFMFSLFIIGRIRRPVTRVKNSDSLIVILTGFLLFLLLVEYASLRPSSPVSIVVLICSWLSLLGIFSYFLKFFSQTRLFVGTFASFGKRLLFLAPVCILLAALIDEGLVFAMKEVINPASIPLAPEVYSIAVPTTTVLVLLVKRLERYTKFVGLELLKDLSSVIISAAFLSFFLRYVVLIAGGTIWTSIVPADELLYTGIATTFVVIGGDAFYVILKAYLKGNTSALTLDRSIFEMGRQLFLADKRQKALDQFLPEPAIARVEPSRAGKIFIRLEKRLTFRIGKRVIKGSTIIFIVLLVSSVGALGVIVPRSTYTVNVSAYRIDLSVVNSMPVDASHKNLMSESMDSVTLGTNYLIPIVHVETGNSSWDAPSNQRYLRLNSSSYIVRATGKYLEFDLKRVTVSELVRGSWLSPPSANLTANDQFAYRGQFKDAEIYFCLWKYGFHNVTRTSSDSVSGTLETILSDTYAWNNNNQHVLVESQLSWSATPGLDTTAIETSVPGFADEVTFLVTQAGVSTSTTAVSGEPPAPFSMMT